MRVECSSLESLRCNNDALVGSEVEASRITVAFLFNIHFLFAVYTLNVTTSCVIYCGCFSSQPDTTSSPSVDAI